MKNFIISFFAAIFIFGAIAACDKKDANAAPYVEVSYLDTDYNYSGPATILLDSSATGISLAGGYMGIGGLPLGVEVEWTDFGQADRSFGIFTTTFDVTAQSLWLVGDVPIGSIGGKPIKLDPRIGITQADAEVGVGPLSISDTDTGFAYGIGVNIEITPAWAVTFDYRKRDLDFAILGTSFKYDPETFGLGFKHTF